MIARQETAFLAFTSSFSLSVSCWRKETPTMFRPTTSCSRCGKKPASHLNASFLPLTLDVGSKRLVKTLSYFPTKIVYSSHPPTNSATMVKDNTPMLQIRYKEREKCYKCATIARELGRPHWKMRTGFWKAHNGVTLNCHRP